MAPRKRNTRTAFSQIHLVRASSTAGPACLVALSRLELWMNWERPCLEKVAIKSYQYIVCRNDSWYTTVYLINGIRYMLIRKASFHQLIPIETDLLLRFPLSSPPCRDTVVRASSPQAFQLPCYATVLCYKLQRVSPRLKRDALNKFNQGRRTQWLQSAPKFGLTNSETMWNANDQTLCCFSGMHRHIAIRRWRLQDSEITHLSIALTPKTKTTIHVQKGWPVKQKAEEMEGKLHSFRMFSKRLPVNKSSTCKVVSCCTW